MSSQVWEWEDEVATALANLEQLALIQSLYAGDMTFYRLTSDKALRTGWISSPPGEAIG